MVDLLLNARLGDGCIHKTKFGSYIVTFSGTQEEWVRHKYLLSGTSNKFTCRQQSPRAYGTKLIYSFNMGVTSDTSRYHNMSMEDCIDLVSIEDLVFLYFDDGSWHKTKGFIHIYTNSLTVEQNSLLIDKIHHLIGYSPVLRRDRKKSGVEYPYLYLGVKGAKELASYGREYSTKVGISCFNYKLGYDSSSTTIS